MGQIKNIKLHIVTDIKVTLKSVVSCYTAKVQTEQLILTKWPIFQLLNLLVCTVLSFCMMTTSTSLVKRWPKSYLLQKSTWKLSGLDFRKSSSRAQHWRFDLQCGFCSSCWWCCPCRCCCRWRCSSCRGEERGSKERRIRIRF